ncbi:MAG: lipopolysaccharide biosynthesis protein [Chloroflexi bacterium]|nr:lipopolysaccharide biosynthesis protein [Chloroflexota bacterium]
MTSDNTSQPQEDPQILQQAVHSIKWTALSQVLPRLITPVTTMLLAALLVPDDFGVVAIATLVISLANIVIGMGFGTTVIQRRTMVDVTANITFWMSLALAFLLYAILWFVSPSISLFYKIPPLTNVLRVVGLSLIISVFSSIPTALLQKNMEFKKIFFIGAGPQIINGLVSLVFALLKFGYWALVIGNLAGSLFGSILAWIFCSWKPRLVWRTELAKSIFRFSFWVLLANFASWFYLYSDNAMAGYFFGSNGVGQYSLGFNISMMLPGMIAAPIASIAYPVLCKLNSHKDVGIELLKFQSLSACLLFPVCLGLSAIAPPVISILYGIKWPELGMVIQMLSILPGMINIWSLNADGFRAIGHPEAWTRASLIGLVVLLPLLFFAGRYGLFEFVLARAIGSIVTPLLCLIISKQFFSISIKSQLRNIASPLISAIIMLVFVFLFIHIFSPFQGLVGIVMLFICIVFGGIIYFLFLRFINRPLFNQIFRLGRQAIFPG